MDIAVEGVADFSAGRGGSRRVGLAPGELIGADYVFDVRTLDDQGEHILQQ